MAKTTKTLGVWTVDENGYEKTASREIVEQTLSVVMKKHRTVVLLGKGYQSGMTIFVSMQTSWKEKLLIRQRV